ncbi:hypothetical protein FS842_010529 [Serendipita sp. 407]|nr:hypothetical protein FS842_010529 [Serendipita sp. 407]
MTASVCTHCPIQSKNKVFFSDSSQWFAIDTGMESEGDLFWGVIISEITLQHEGRIDDTLYPSNVPNSYQRLIHVRHERAFKREGSTDILLPYFRDHPKLYLRDSGRKKPEEEGIYLQAQG